MRYVPSENYYARFRSRGKLVWKSLDTNKISIAQLRLTDLLGEYRARFAEWIRLTCTPSRTGRASTAVSKLNPRQIAAWPAGLRQLANDFPASLQRAGASAAILEEAMRVNAQQVEDRRGQVLRALRARRRVAADAVARADDLPTAHPATRQRDGEAMPPVVTPAAAVVLGRAPELAHRHDERFVEQTALVQVREQRGIGGVERRAEHIADALAEQVRARLELVRHRLQLAVSRAPYEGIVVEGDLRQRLASPVKLGEALFRLARTDALYVEAEVNERDIHELLDKRVGEIAFVSQPKLKFPVTIKRIEPAAVTKQAGNFYIVRLEFAGQPETWWRPGMSGLTKLEVGKRTPLWVATHRTVDFLRMFFWW